MIKDLSKNRKFVQNSKICPKVPTILTTANAPRGQKASDFYPFECPCQLMKPLWILNEK